MIKNVTNFHCLSKSVFFNKPNGDCDNTKRKIKIQTTSRTFLKRINNKTGWNIIFLRGNDASSLRQRPHATWYSILISRWQIDFFSTHSQTKYLLYIKHNKSTLKGWIIWYFNVFWPLTAHLSERRLMMSIANNRKNTSAIVVRQRGVYGNKSWGTQFLWLSYEVVNFEVGRTCLNYLRCINADV